MPPTRPVIPEVHKDMHVILCARATFNYRCDALYGFCTWDYEIRARGKTSDMSLLQDMAIKMIMYFWNIMWFRGKVLDARGKWCCVINCLDKVFSSPKHTPVNWILFQGLKQMRHVDAQSLPSSVEVKGWMSISSFVLYAFMACTGPT